MAASDGRSFSRTIFLSSAFALTAILFFALSQMRDVVVDRRLSDARTANEIARAILGTSAKVGGDARNISIHYDLGSWYLTQGSMRSTYQGNVIRLVPTVFERLPEASQVEVVADNIFDTIQGREVRQPAISMMFTRSTAARVGWRTVTKDEIARLADRAWVTPAIGW